MSLVALLLVVNLTGLIHPVYADLKGLRQEENALQVNFLTHPSLGEKKHQLDTGYFPLNTEKRKNNQPTGDRLVSVDFPIGYQSITKSTQYVALDRGHLETLLKISSFKPHQQGSAKLLQAELILSSPQKNQSNVLRSSSHFLNFSIMVSLIIAIFLILLREKSKLFFSYLNFFRLSLARERENTHMGNARPTKFHIFHYLFNSLLAAFVMLVILHFVTDEVRFAKYFSTNSLFEDFYQWTRLSGLMMAMLASKFIIVWFVSTLFGNKEGMYIQFYNYLIFLFFAFSLAGVVCLMYFIFGVTNNGELYNFLIYGIICAMILWVMIIGVKVLNQSTYPFSYLFFYLCVSEFIPTVFIIRMLTLKIP